MFPAPQVASAVQPMRHLPLTQIDGEGQEATHGLQEAQAFAEGSDDGT